MVSLYQVRFAGWKRCGVGPKKAETRTARPMHTTTKHQRRTYKPIENTQQQQHRHRTPIAKK